MVRSDEAVGRKAEGVGRDGAVKKAAGRGGKRARAGQGGAVKKVVRKLTADVGVQTVCAQEDEAEDEDGDNIVVARPRIAKKVGGSAEERKDLETPRNLMSK